MNVRLILDIYFKNHDKPLEREVCGFERNSMKNDIIIERYLIKFILHTVR